VSKRQEPPQTAFLSRDLESRNAARRQSERARNSPVEDISKCAEFVAMLATPLKKVFA
jgi:hypothetical protein